MKQYQEFVDVLEKFNKEMKIPSMRSFPKNFGKDKDYEYWQEYGESLKHKIGYDLSLARVFEIDDRTKRAMLMTNIPKDTEILSTLRLPYKSIFLNLELSSIDEDIGFGNKIAGVLISEQYVKKNDVFFFVFFTLYQETGISFEHFKISFTDIKDEIEYAKGTKKTQNILKRLVVNTILFINEPDVEYVFRPRSEKNRQRREKQGKMPLPDSYVIKLTGRIKKYFDEFGDSFERDGYSYQFDVRGSWRHFRSEKFKRIRSMNERQLEKEGYRVKDGYPCLWIPPFKKGQGVYIKKNYSLEKPLGDDEVDLDSIPEGKKPLRKIMEKKGLRK